MPLKQSLVVRARSVRTKTRIKIRDKIEYKIVWPYLGQDSQKLQALVTFSKQWPRKSSEFIVSNHVFEQTSKRRTARKSDWYVEQLVGKNNIQLENTKLSILTFARKNREKSPWRDWALNLPLIWSRVEEARSYDIEAIFLDAPSIPPWDPRFGQGKLNWGPRSD